MPEHWLLWLFTYLHRREKELDEYERLLFGEDDAATVEPEAPAAEEAAPAEDAAE